MRQSFLSKLSCLSWVRKLLRNTLPSDSVRPVKKKHTRRGTRLGFETLEERSTPALLAEFNNSLVIVLDNPGENLTITAASANHYSLASSANLFANGLQGAVYTPSTGSSGTVVITSDTGIEINDDTTDTSVTFGQSNSISYGQSVNVSLSNPLSGDVTFIGSSHFAQDLSIQTVNGNITDGGSAGIFVAGNLTLTAGNDITLAGTGGLNDAGQTTLQANGDISVSAGNVAFVDVSGAGGLGSLAASASITTTAALKLDQVDVNGSLNVTAGGGISQSSGSHSSGLTVGGTASFTSSTGGVTLSNKDNSFAWDVLASVTGGNAIALANQNDITLGTIGLGTGSLLVTSFNGNILEDPADSITTDPASTNTFSLSANGNIELTGANNLAPGVTVSLTSSSSGDFSLNDTNAGALPTQISENSFSINNLTLEFDNAAIAADAVPTFGTDLTLIAGGDITQTAALNVNGNASFTSTGGNITLSNTFNTFNGDISAAVSATGSKTIQLDNSTQTTTLGTIVLGKGALTVNDDSNFGFSSITEDPAAGGISTALGSTATLSFNVVNDTSATVDLSPAANNIPATVTVAVTGTNVLGPTVGDFGFRNSDAAATLSQLSFTNFSINNLSVIFDTSSAAFDVAALASLPLSTPGKFQTLTVTTAGNITQTAAITVTGDATFNVLGNSSAITLTNGNNALSGSVSFNVPAADGSSVKFKNDSDILLGSSTLGTGTFQVTAGGSGKIKESSGDTITQPALANTITLVAGGDTIDLSGGDQNFFTGQLSFSGSNVTTVSLEDANSLATLDPPALSLSGVPELTNLNVTFDGLTSSTVLPSESINYNLDLVETNNIVLPAASALTVTGGSGLTLKSNNGSIVLLGQITVAGTTTLMDYGSPNNVTLATAGNNSFGTLDLTTASGIAAQVTASGTLEFGDSSVQGTLQATAAAFSQAGPGFSSAPGATVSFTATTGNVTLDSTSNSLGDVSASVTGSAGITLNSTTGVTLDTIALGTGSLTVNEDGSAGFSSITEDSSGGITAAAGSAGTIKLNVANDSAADIDISSGANFIPTTMAVKITGATGGTSGDFGFRNINPLAVISQVTFTNYNVNNLTVVFDNTSINYDNTFPSFSGSITLQTNGNITQSQAILANGGSFTVGNLNTTAPADGSIVLTKGGNDISGPVSFSDRNGDNKQQVSFTNNGTIDLGQTFLGLGTFTLTANNSGNVFSSGRIRQDLGGGAIIVSAAGTQIFLGSTDNEISGPVTLTGGNVTSLQFSNGDPLATLPSITGLNSQLKNVSFNLDSAPVFFTQPLNVSGNLFVTAGGNIGQAAAANLTVAGEATFDTTSGNFGIQLTNAGNAIAEVSLANSGQAAVSLTTNGALVFDGSNLGSGAVTIVANGPITQTINPIVQSMNANDGLAGTFTLNAGANPILLDNPSNNIIGPISVTATGAGGNVTIQNGAWILLSNSAVGGSLSLTSSGNNGIMQAPGASLNVTGNVFLAASNGGITLGNPGNTIGGQISLEAQNSATLQVTGAVKLATSSVNGELSVTAGGDITQLAGLSGSTNGVINAEGASFTSLTGNIMLMNAGNNFQDSTVSLSASATGKGISLTDSDVPFSPGGLLLGAVTFGSGGLSITAANNVAQQDGSAITGSGPVSISNSSADSANAFNVTLDQAGNNITGAGTFTLANVANVTIINQGNIALAVPNSGPGISTSADVSLFAGGQVTLPNVATLTLGSLNVTAATTTIGTNITTESDGLSFVGGVNFTAAVTLDTSAAGAEVDITFNGNVSITGSNALVFNLAGASMVELMGGVWSQGANNLTINGTNVTFQIDSGATFSMSGGTLNLTGVLAGPGGGGPSANNNIEVDGTFQVGGNVTIADGGSDSIFSVSFNSGSVLSVALGGTPGLLTLNGLNASDLVDIQGGALSGFAGTAPAGSTTILTINNGGGLIGTFNNPQDIGGDILMGTDMVTPAYSPTSIAITPVAAGAATVSGNQKDGDKYTVSLTGGTGLVVIAASNASTGGLDIVVRDPSSATMLTVTTTANGGDGFTRIDGIAVDGNPDASAVTIAAGTSNIQTGNINVLGTLTSLTLHDWQDGTLTAGGSASGSSAITGDVFASVAMTLDSKLSTLTVAALQGLSSELPTITAASFGTIKANGNAANNTPGNFEATLVDSPTASTAVSAATVAGTLSGAWQLAGSVGTVSAANTESFSLGVASGANVANGGLLTSVTSAGLGTGNADSIFATGSVGTLSAVSLSSSNSFQAKWFGTIKTTGNAVTGDHGNLDAVITATGNAGGTTSLALNTLSVAGSLSGSLQVNNGNVGTITVTGTVQTITINAVSAASSGSITTITAGAWNQGILNAKSVGTWSIIGNLAAHIFGTYSGSATLTGVSGSTAVALGTFSTTRDVTNSDFLIVNGSITTFSVGGQLMGSTITLESTGAGLGTISAAQWENDTVIARSIGTFKSTGRAAATAATPALNGDVTDTTVFVFQPTSATTPGIGTVSVAGTLSSSSPGNAFMIVNGGITTFTVNRAVNEYQVSANLNGGNGGIATLTAGSWANSDIAAAFLGTVKITGFATPELTSGFVNGDFTGTAVVISGANSTTHLGIGSMTVTHNLTLAGGSTFDVPFGIGSLTVTGTLSGGGSEIDLDLLNPGSPTSGTLGTLSAGQIQDVTIEAERATTIQTTGSAALHLNGDLTSTNIAVAGFAGTTTAPVGIATFSVAGNFDSSNLEVKDGITTFKVVQSVLDAQVAAAFDHVNTAAKIGTLSVGSMSMVGLATNSIGTFAVVGNATHFIAGSLANAQITIMGNAAGVALGTFTAAGAVKSCDIQVTSGNVTSFTSAFFKQSALFVGYSTVDITSITDAVNNQQFTNWEGTFSLGTFKTTAVFNNADPADSAGFQNSDVVAGRLTTITISGLNSQSAATSIGIGFRNSSGAHGTLTINGVTEPNPTVIGQFNYFGLGG